MLLRLYRLSDKLGIVLLKLAAASADWLLDGVGVLASFLQRGTGGFFGIILSIIMGILAFLGMILKGLGRVFSFILARFGFTIGKASQSTIRTGSTIVSEGMARRAARDEIDVIIKEDPLRIQNRRLSFIVLILGIVVVGVLLYATDPNRNNQAVPIAVLPVNNNTQPQATVETNPENFNLPSTPIPTATALPEALRARGSIAYTVRERGQTDIWALGVGSRNPIRISNSPADDRDPEWNATGTRLAYASRQNGNWDIYVYDLEQNLTSPLSVDLSFQANPTWSPDGNFIAYENYIGDNLDIYAISIDGSTELINLSEHPAPDFSPAWTPLPSGREIAFVSLRDGNQEIYILNLDTAIASNLTNTPLLNEDYPTWSPDGRFIAYSAWEQGSEKVFIRSLVDLGAPPQLIALGRTPTWSPDGGSIVFAVDSLDASRTDLYAVTIGEGSVPILVASLGAGSTAPTWTNQPLPASLVNSGGLPLAVDVLFTEQTDTFDGSNFLLQSLGNVQTELATLSDAVNDSYNALRQRVLEATGDDYLDTLDDAFWDINRLSDLGEPRLNWHRTGRAFAIPSNGILGLPPPIEIVREEIGTEIYWRVFVRVVDTSQRGQLGEPLRRLPWDFLAATSGNVDAYNQGGAYRTEVPAGYYIDLTQLAADYGWERQAAGRDWIANERARNYWLFVNDGGLDWCQAMLQLYSEGELINYGCTE